MESSLDQAGSLLGTMLLSSSQGSRVGGDELESAEGREVQAGGAEAAKLKGRRAGSGGNWEVRFLGISRFSQEPQFPSS